jgi:hypothetical protein
VQKRLFLIHLLTNHRLGQVIRGNLDDNEGHPFGSNV